LHETGQKLLNLMFRPGEEVCVSHNKYAYHSFSLENAFKDQVTLVPPDMERPNEFVKSDKLTLVALNPIHGFRSDEKCTAFRNFLIEMDDFELKAQIEYIKSLGMPYSAIVFSGNKSMHFLISLDTDLPNEKIWRKFAEWLLNIATLADQATKNPSRSIRIPGGMRTEGLQRLVELKGPVKLTDLAAFLAKHPEAQPKEPERRVKHKDFNFPNIGDWCIELLLDGLKENQGRNRQWYAVGFEFALSGVSEDETIEFLGRYFTPERDFKEREWLVTIKSAFKHAYEEM
jgi:hypothetical protein